MTPVENLEFALASYASWHRIRGVPGLADRAQGRFDGFSGEVAWRFLPREAGRSSRSVSDADSKRPLRNFAGGMREG